MSLWQFRVSKKDKPLSLAITYVVADSLEAAIKKFHEQSKYLAYDIDSATHLGLVIL